jgi:hypothetical protein
VGRRLRARRASGRPDGPIDQEDPAVTSRSLTSWTTLAVALALTVPTAAPAASVQNFRLSNQGSQPIARVDFNIVPPGSVVPPVVGTDPTTGEATTGSPLTVLPGSSGFDENLFSVALGKDTSGDQQILRLLFGQTQTVDTDGQVTFAPMVDENGDPIGLFEPGGQVEFALSVDPGAAGSVQLQLPETTAGLVLQGLPFDDVTANPPGTDTEGPGGGGTPVVPPATQVPEPMPLAVWGVLVGLGLLRVHTYRRCLARR